MQDGLIQQKTANQFFLYPSVIGKFLHCNKLLFRFAQFFTDLL